MHVLRLLLILICLGLALPVSAKPTGAPTSTTLENHVVVASQVWDGLELGDQVLMSFGFRGGVVEEPSSHRGLTNYLAQTLSRTIAAAIQAPGDPDAPLVGVELDLEYMAIQVVTSRERFATNWPVILDLLEDREQTWTKFAPDVKEIAANLAPLQADGFFMTDMLLRSLMFGSAPYVTPPLGTPPTVGDLSEADLKAWGKRMLQPDRCILALVHPSGLNVAPLPLEIALWGKQKNAPEQRPITLPDPSYSKESLRPMEGIVPVMSLGALGPAVHAPDLPAFLVVAAALGDAQSGIFTTVREEGAGQAIRIEWDVERHAEASIASLQFAMDIDGDIFELYQRVMSRLESALLSGLSNQEIARAQGQLQVALDDRLTDPVAMGSWLTTWSVWESLTAGRRFDAKIAAVTPDEVNRVFRRYFALDRIALAGLAGNLPDDYYFPNERDVYWGTFKRPRDRGLEEEPRLEHYDPSLGPPATDQPSGR